MSRGWAVTAAGLLLFAAQAHAQSSADLAASKSGPAVADAGTDVTYRVGIANVGPDDAVGARIDDAMPAGMTFVSATQLAGPAFTCATPPVGDSGAVTCDVATLPAGASATFDLTYGIPAGTPDGTVFTNVATVSEAAAADPNPENDQAVAVTAVGSVSADLAIAKQAPAYAPPGGEIAYVVTLTHAGVDAATNVVVVDTLPGDLTFVSLSQTGTSLACTTPAIGAGGTITCTAATYAPGSTTRLDLVARVPDATPSGTEYTNVASVDGDGDATEENDTASATTLIGSADLSLTKTGPASAVAGSNLTYDLVVANAGPDPANVGLVDPLPAGTTFVSATVGAGPMLSCTRPAVGANGTVACTATLAPGASSNLQLVVRASPGLANGSTVVNAASASAELFDPDSSDDGATVSTAISNTTDLAVTKSAPATAAAGSTIAYALVAANAGPDAARDVTLTDVLPAGTTFVSIARDAGPASTCTTPAVGATGTVSCATPALAAGEAVRYTLVVAVAGTTPNGTTITNTVSAATTSVDANPANDTSSTATSITNQADLAVTKTGPAAATAGAVVDYTLVLRNLAATPALTAAIVDVLPATLAFESIAQVAGPTFACTTPAVGASGTVRCDHAALAAGAEARFTLRARIATTAADGAVVSNTASATSSNVDVNPANDTATATLVVGNRVELAIAKATTTSGAIVAGQTVAYAITIENRGNVAATTATITDALPAGSTFVSLAQASGPAFACTTPAVGATGTVSCTRAGLEPAKPAQFALTVQISPAYAGRLDNTASATGTGGGGAVGAASSTASFVVGGAPAAPVPVDRTIALLLLAFALVAFGQRRARERRSPRG